MTCNNWDLTMLKTIDETDEPPSMNAPPPIDGGGQSNKIIDLTRKNTSEEKPGFIQRIRNFILPRTDTSLRETLKEYVSEADLEEANSIESHEKALLTNILKLRNLTVVDVMVPRADIIAIDIETDREELLKLLAEKQHSRIPVFHDTLDDVLGTVHIKDIMAAIARNQEINIKELVREIPVVSPAMHVLDLLLQMRESRKHMSLVVDEFGGIDGLVTMGDVIETIVGEIEDEYDPDEQPEITMQDDGSVFADGRVDLDDFEERFGQLFTEDEREESDTLGGLVFLLAGRVPARGEILTHNNGMTFEVLDADPRRINRLRISNIPSR